MDRGARELDEALAEVERLQALRAKRKARVSEEMRVLRAEVEAVHAERDEALAEVERLRGLLRRVEWVEDLDGLVCPLCSLVSDLDGGHADDCELAAALDHREADEG